jgi:hypothetical protein
MGGLGRIWLEQEGVRIEGGFCGEGIEGYLDVYLIKTDGDGNEEWSKTYGGNKDDYEYSVQRTSDGEYVVAGVTESSGAGSYDVYVVKTK